VAIDNAARLSQVPLADLVELRVVLEGAAVEMAAGRRDGLLSEARAAVDVMCEPDIDIERFRAADVRFHGALAGAAGNAAFPLIMGVLRSAIGSHLGEALDREPDPPKAMAKLAKEHGAILKAVLEGKGKRARELVTAHVRQFYRDPVRLPASGDRTPASGDRTPASGDR
jgi:DNA-binding FadR family transcriptional regulator